MNIGSNGFALASLAAQVGNAATAGFGLSLGRDIYRKVRPDAFTIFMALLTICGPVLPVLGGMGLVQGYRRGWIGTIFLTIGLSTFAIVAGFFLMIFIAALFDGILLGIRGNNFIDFVKAYGGWILAATAGLTLLGTLIGLRRRVHRLRRFATIDHNEAFLAGNGFKATRGRDVTHYDRDGNALRFLEASSNKLVFMAVGRRGRRAYIDLDDAGRMLSYTGIV